MVALGEGVTLGGEELNGLFCSMDALVYIPEATAE